MNIFETFGQILLLIILLAIALVLIGFAVATVIVLIRSALRWQPKDRIDKNIETLSRTPR